MTPSEETDPTLTPSQAPAVADTVAATDPDVPPSGGPVTARGVHTGYELGELLGHGGMGEVLLARDLRIDRQVAVKRMRGASPAPEAIARFLREAKIQARLDHPAIVPVHELGTDAEGRPFFTMKRLAGTTLAEVLAARRDPLQKLLRVFVDVCQAIEFAHARGVIHRDLKPSNVMLGEYGEVYVLDWGVARVIGDREHLPAAGIDSLEGHTQVGAILGTPGYMSPEQVRGETVAPATDVYALGAILFEILAGEPAHPRRQAALVTTLGPVPSPSERAPDRSLAPELEAACVDALAEAAERRPTAGVLAERVQRYLDGDRDLERRRTLAGEEVARARAAFDSGDPARRAEAMRAAGRAIVLDPDSVDAAGLILREIVEPPRELPAELDQRLVEIDHQLASQQAKLASRSLLAYLTIIPIVIWLGVRDWPVVLGAAALVIGTIAGAEYMRRKPGHPIYWAIITNTLLMVLLSRFVSPFVLVPGVIATAMVSLIVFPTLLARPWAVLVPFVASFVLPIILEWTGVWSRTIEIVGDHLEIRSAALNIDQMAVVFLTAATIVMLIVTPLYVRSLAVAQRHGRRQLEIQAWHLGKLLPVDTPRPALPVPTRCEL